MDDLLDLLLSRINGFGLRHEIETQPAIPDLGYDAVLRLSRGRGSEVYALTLKESANLSSLVRSPGTAPFGLPMLLGAPHISPRTAEALRRAEVQYLDAAGNAFIRFGDVLVDVRGRQPAKGTNTQMLSRSPVAGNLFSTARAQVAFALLQWPALWKRPQREVAQTAGVSLGQANNALTMFREAGFGPGGHQRDGDFLTLWIAAFPGGLARKLLLTSYHGDIEDFRRNDPSSALLEAGAVVSGEVAAQELRHPATLTLYLPELDPRLAIRHHWRSDRAANIFVRKKFWHPLFEKDDRLGPPALLPTAPEVLLFADLLSSDDPRVRSLGRERRELWRA
ncbi:MAG: type IV toxin-antitoxin system AbiEi family antitoxin [Motilibacteraceae bacterium]